ncbi:MAG: DUF1538 domain-containing protein [Oscillibacter sp.]|nr:DUF1538 domain-containing protein [Oscillibacter sp.]
MPTWFASRRFCKSGGAFVKQLKETMLESLHSVLPISAIVLVLSMTIAPLDSGVLVLVLFGTLLLIVGIGLFTIGSGVSMQPLGEGIGVQLSRSKRVALPVVCCFVLGMLITIAEPDLQVLAQQIPSIPNAVLIMSVAVGVGVFLSIAMLRSFFGLPLAKLLVVFYLIVILLACFAPEDFIPAAFDSGGVTTGPITVPFIMALGAGMASLRSDKHSGVDSFGLVALCSVGPILSVLILSICYEPSAQASQNVLPQVVTTKDAIMAFVQSLPTYAEEVSIAFLPIVGVFVLFQLVFRRFHYHQVVRICIGFIYTFIGLVLFLTGANVGFMPAGQLIGATIAAGSHRYWLIPVGMLMGYFVVTAEPAVYTLKKQVAEITNGAISQRAIGYGLSIGVACAVGIAMLRVLTGIPIFPIMLVGYTIALAISFFVPPIYTGIAFDSGGVASGPMTTTFMLPLAMGACEALGGNVLTDAFGLVAMVAIAPLITIQVMGLSSRIKSKRLLRKAADELSQIDDCIIYYDKKEAA